MRRLAGWLGAFLLLFALTPKAEAAMDDKTLLALIADMMAIQPLDKTGVEAALNIQLTPTRPPGGALDIYTGGGAELRTNERGGIVIVAVDGPSMDAVYGALQDRYGAPRPSHVMGEAPPDHPRYYAYHVGKARLSLAFTPNEPRRVVTVIVDRFPE